MKGTFALAFTVGLQSLALANVPIGSLIDYKNKSFHDVLDAPPVPFNDKQGLDVRFIDLGKHKTKRYSPWFYPVSEGTPVDTFTFRLSPSSHNVPPANQSVFLNVTGLRTKVDPKIALSFRACDSAGWEGKRCYPDSKSVAFDKESLQSSNTSSFELSEFGGTEKGIYLYLQIMQEPGKDNPLFNVSDPSTWKISDNFETIVQDLLWDESVALTIQLGTYARVQKYGVVGSASKKMEDPDYDPDYNDSDMADDDFPEGDPATTLDNGYDDALPDDY